MYKLITTSILFVTCSLLIGCGFQLKGSISLPEGVEPFYIAGPSTITPDLNNYFSVYSIQTTTDKNQSNHTFEILNYNNQRKEASLGDNNKVLEYLLIQTVVFQVKNSRGQVILGPKKISEQRILKNDPSAVGSTNQESRLLIKEMKQSIISRATTQLRVFDFSNSGNIAQDET